MSSLRRWLERRRPYQSLVILLVPFAVVEPSKLAAVAIVGQGHWLTGTIVIIIAYALSIFVVERLFKILKPRVLRLPWFAKGWGWFIVLRAKTMALFDDRAS